jgi:hypothetical protein
MEGVIIIKHVLRNYTSYEEEEMVENSTQLIQQEAQ